LPLSILADESVDFRIIEYLRNKDINIISVLEKHRSISDKDILKLSIEYNSIILTEDSDFGEWIFSYKEKANGILFLRYKLNELNEICESILSVIKKYKQNLYTKFVVITTKKIRIRALI
jgi:predicted nuclease of predicted toxin-antitoxin system